MRAFLAQVCPVLTLGGRFSHVLTLRDNHDRTARHRHPGSPMARRSRYPGELGSVPRAPARARQRRPRHLLTEILFICWPGLSGNRKIVRNCANPASPIEPASQASQPNPASPGHPSPARPSQPKPAQLSQPAKPASTTMVVTSPDFDLGHRGRGPDGDVTCLWSRNFSAQYRRAQYSTAQ